MHVYRKKAFAFVHARAHVHTKHISICIYTHICMYVCTAVVQPFP